MPVAEREQENGCRTADNSIGDFRITGRIGACALTRKGADVDLVSL
jgi:hypothetical protein